MCISVWLLKDTLLRISKERNNPSRWLDFNLIPYELEDFDLSPTRPKELNYFGSKWVLPQNLQLRAIPVRKTGDSWRTIQNGCIQWLKIKCIPLNEVKPAIKKLNFQNWKIFDQDMTLFLFAQRNRSYRTFCILVLRGENVNLF